MGRENTVYKLMLLDNDKVQLQQLIRKMKKTTDDKGELQLLEVLQVRLASLDYESSMEQVRLIIRLLRRFGFGLVNYAHKGHELDDQQTQAEIARTVKLLLDVPGREVCTEEEAKYLTETLIGHSFVLPDSVHDNFKGCSVSDVLGALFGCYIDTETDRHRATCDVFLREGYGESLAKDYRSLTTDKLVAPNKYVLKSLVSRWLSEAFLPFHSMPLTYKFTHREEAIRLELNLADADSKIGCVLVESEELIEQFDCIVDELKDYEPHKKGLMKISSDAKRHRADA